MIRPPRRKQKRTAFGADSNLETYETMIHKYFAALRVPTAIAGQGAPVDDHREKRPVTLRRTLEAEPFFYLREVLFFLLWLAALRRAVGLHSSSNEIDSSAGGKITMCAWR